VSAERVAALLGELGGVVRDRVVAARDAAIEATGSTGGLSEMVGSDESDAIYGIDKVGEHEITGWFAARWPSDVPVAVVMEGASPMRFGGDGDPGTILLDPIDGTRGLMYDKRSAWVLAGWAPPGSRTLADITVAVQTEIPTTGTWRSRQLGAVVGSGAWRVDHDLVRGGSVVQPPPRPSDVSHVLHGYASIAKFFPEGKSLLAAVDERLMAALGASSTRGYPLVFDDQYACTGGQIGELAMGRDRFVADLRPLAFARLGVPLAMTVHPYDICTWPVLTEAGGVVEAPLGGPLDAPLDTTSAVAWVGYANERLAAAIRPHLHAAIADLL
jgi:hypothetical protein